MNTKFYKDELARRLQIPPVDPGAFHIHSEITDEGGDSYPAQMTAEYLDDEGMWACPSHKPNHYWDCEVLAWAAADMAGMRFRGLPAQEEEEVPKPRRFTNRRRTRLW